MLRRPFSRSAIKSCVNHRLNASRRQANRLCYPSHKRFCSSKEAAEKAEHEADLARIEAARKIQMESLQNQPLTARLKRMVEIVNERDRHQYGLGWHFHFWCFLGAILPSIAAWRFAEALREEMRVLKIDLKGRQDGAYETLLEKPVFDDQDLKQLQKDTKISDQVLGEVRQQVLVTRVTQLEENLSLLEQKLSRRSIDPALMAQRIFNLLRNPKLGDSKTFDQDKNLKGETQIYLK